MFGQCPTTPVYMVYLLQYYCATYMTTSCRVVFAGGGWGGGHVLVTEFRGIALNGFLFCADVLRPLDLVPLTE